MTAPVTVAVVSWNTRDLLRTCLTSLEPEHQAGLTEVWVVDNGSSDGSVDLVRREFEWVNLIASDRNLGFGPAVNAVMQQTESDWIAPANADIALEAGALRHLLRAGEADADVGVVAPRLVMFDGRTQHSVHPFPSLASAAFTSFGAARWFPEVADRLCVPGYWQEERERLVDWAHGAFFLVRRSAFASIEGFDGAQWMYAEDLDIAWRLAKSGWPTRYVPRARVRHAVSAAAEQAWGSERALRSMTATYDWIRRRRGRAFAFAFAVLNITGTGFRAAAYRLAKAAGGGHHHTSEYERLRWHMQLHLRGYRGHVQRVPADG